MFGSSVLMPVADIDRTARLVIMGANPAVSNGSVSTMPNAKQVDWNIGRKGRSWRKEAMQRWELTPEKIEMVDGRVLETWAERIHGSAVRRRSILPGENHITFVPSLTPPIRRTRADGADGDALAR